jgi:hypothetical protein
VDKRHRRGVAGSADRIRGGHRGRQRHRVLG